MKKAACVINPVCSVLLTVAVIVEAQQSKKVPRIGYLSWHDPDGQSARAEAFRQALLELGYVEGKNIAIEHRYAEGKSIGLPSLRPSWFVSRLISSS